MKRLFQKLKKTLIHLKNRPPIYSEKTLLMAFEFGLVLSESAKKMNVAMTPEISERAEKIVVAELKSKGARQTALNFIPLVMASLEVEETKEEE